MYAMHIEQCETEYVLPESVLGERRRLDRIRDLVFDSFLESALERAGISPRDEICLREIRTRVRLRLSASDQALALAWAAALAISIRETLDRGGADWVVRYRSRMHALVDLAEAVAVGGMHRAWAWRQLGFGEVDERSSAAQAKECLVAVLQREPENIVPVVCALAQRQRFGSLASKLAPGDWRLLGEAALGHAFGRPVEILPRAGQSGTSFPVDAERAGVVERTLKSSVLAAAAIEQARFLLHVESVRFALAALALLEAAPGVVRPPTEHVSGLIKLVAALLGDWSEGSKRGPSRAPEQSAATPPSAQASHPRTETKTAPSRAEASGESSKEGLARDVSAAGQAPGQTAARERPIPTLRTEGMTQMGGLLYLIHVVDDLELIDELQTAQPFRGRPLRWTLHRAAMTLGETVPHDAAALAFAGLGPAAQPPSQHETPPTDDEQSQLLLVVERIMERGRERLAASNPHRAAEIREMAPGRLKDWICRRNARVIADPGWIEAHFKLDDVFTEIRRAGLDLDPGYVPWLGVVLKYVYE